MDSKLEVFMKEKINNSHRQVYYLNTAQEEILKNHRDSFNLKKTHHMKLLIAFIYSNEQLTNDFNKFIEDNKDLI